MPTSTPRRRLEPLLGARGTGTLAASVLAFALLLFAGLAAPGHSASDEALGDDTAASASPQPAPETTFLDSVTVAATRSERKISETPGQIDVISRSSIEERGYQDFSDLVRYLPGVYVDGDPTRLGLNGFNIRGVGGNRVLTQVDGVPTSEQFDFGPLSVSQFGLDVDTLERVEIVRSAGSALYGSDALGGVVSLVTRGPRSYLGGRPQHLGFRTGWDGRSDEASGSAVYARGQDRWQGSAVLTYRSGHELDNQGEIDTSDSSRTAPNPIDRRQANLLTKLGYTPASGSQLEVTFESFDGRADTEVLSAHAPASPFAGAVLDFDAVDRQQRQRLSAEQSLVLQSPVADSLIWRAYAQQADTEQVTDELRMDGTDQFVRDSLFTFDHETIGVEAEARKALTRSGRQSLTYGLAVGRDELDILRDRSDLYLADGSPVPTTLIFPSKYFPESVVDELGLFVQAELELFQGRVRLIPGMRYDRYELDPDDNDRAFLDGNPGQPAPVGLTDDSISPKLGVVVGLNDELSAFAQYAAGFRAPPMSAVNNGFTNQAGGYRTLPNPDLEPETSDNFELGVRGSYRRGSFTITAFENQYDDFIDLVTVGFNPVNFLIEFQSQNVAEVEISGIEVAGELRLARGWSLHGAYTHTEGDDLVAGEPLASIAPPSLVTGLRYRRPDGRWAVEGIVQAVSDKDADDLPSESTQARLDSYQLFDLTGWFSINERWSLQASAWNLTDETYLSWAFARGQSEGSSTLDRFTSPGRSVGLQVRVEF